MSASARLFKQAAKPNPELEAAMKQSAADFKQLSNRMRASVLAKQQLTSRLGAAQGSVRQERLTWFVKALSDPDDVEWGESIRLILQLTDEDKSELLDTFTVELRQLIEQS